MFDNLLCIFTKNNLNINIKEIENTREIKRLNIILIKFIHGKSSVNEITVAADQYNYLYPVKLADRIYLGGKRLDRIWHYHDKKLMDTING